MNLRRQRHEDPEVTLTPLIDVVLLLLIFFMISTTFQREARLQVELPEASLDAAAAPERKLEITIDVAGNYFLNGQQVTNRKPATLKKAITRLLDEARDIPVTIRADANTPHQAVVIAMDVARQLGLLNLSIATTPVPTAP